MPEFQILLVDDLQSEAHIFESALEEAGGRARLYWVSSGEEALDFLLRRARFIDMDPVKIVVLDLHLDGEDGLAILREIKAHPDLNRTPVVMLSSSTDQSEIDLAYSLGANAFFRKPMSLASYVDLVQILTKHWLDLAQLPSPGTRFGSDAQGLRQSSIPREMPEDKR